MAENTQFCLWCFQCSCNHRVNQYVLPHLTSSAYLTARIFLSGRNLRYTLDRNPHLDVTEHGDSEGPTPTASCSVCYQYPRNVDGYCSCCYYIYLQRVITDLDASSRGKHSLFYRYMLIHALYSRQESLYLCATFSSSSPTYTVFSEEPAKNSNPV